jgi:hypothetical protein
MSARQSSPPTIGLPARRLLADACERRLGRVVVCAGVFDLRRLASPEGIIEWCKPHRLVVALTETELWIIELRHYVFAPKVGAVLGQFPRQRLVAQWHHRRRAWPMVWSAELSWPESATLVEGSMMNDPDTDTFIGLLAADEFERELRRDPPGA